MKSIKTHYPPKKIRPEAKNLWKSVHKDYQIEDASREILRVACLSLSRFLEAREKLDKEGLTFTTNSGQVKKNPLIEIEKISRQGFLSAMNSLGLEVESDNKNRPGRPTIHGV